MWSTNYFVTPRPSHSKHSRRIRLFLSWLTHAAHCRGPRKKLIKKSVPRGFVPRWSAFHFWAQTFFVIWRLAKQKKVYPYRTRSCTIHGMCLGWVTVQRFPQRLRASEKWGATSAVRSRCPGFVRTSLVLKRSGLVLHQKSRMKLWVRVKRVVCPIIVTFFSLNGCNTSGVWVRST